MIRLRFVAVTVAVFTLVATSWGQVRAPSDLDAYVERVLEAFEVPGVSVAIVKDGDVIVAKGYGVKMLGEPDTVDEHTLFGIASNTKAFTATGLGMLVEEGKLEWNAPVIDYLPWFRMSDPFVTREMTIRDLLVHRSGLALGAGDLMWWPPTDYDRKEIVRRLRYLPLKTSFRSAYAYDNVLYIVAGEVIEAVSGQSWENFIESRILVPLGMSESNVRHSISGVGRNTATTHAPIGGEVKIVQPFQSDNTNPAGGINSNAVDIAKWLVVQLDSGRVAQDRRLFSPRITRELWSIVTPIPSGTPAPELSPLKTNFNGYALGFGIRDYRGKKLVTHTGFLPGYASRVAMIPKLKLGIAVFTNQESGDAYNSITHYILDHYLGVSDTDWLQAFQTVRERIKASVRSVDDASLLVPPVATRPSLALDAYTGVYQDIWYGNIIIEHGEDDLRIRFAHTPSLVGDLIHYMNDTFIAKWDDRELRADSFVIFDLNADGSVYQARMRAVSRATDFSFDFHHLRLRPIE